MYHLVGHLSITYLNYLSSPSLPLSLYSLLVHLSSSSHFLHHLLPPYTLPLLSSHCSLSPRTCRGIQKQIPGECLVWHTRLMLTTLMPRSNVPLLSSFTTQDNERTSIDQINAHKSSPPVDHTLEGANSELKAVFLKRRKETPT